jgi:hypothetical protein
MPQNLLAGESSPYLLQHKDNPVAWMPWGDEALARARDENKPILMSIGYAACHWCHVMAHESFENPAIAALMNDGFVNIKVDREERPDLDTIYQHALVLLGEQGGWPLTMFLTPQGEPFWGGTYFPPEPRYGRPGFSQVLDTIRGVYTNTPDRVRANVSAIHDGLDRLSKSNPGGTVSIAKLDAMARRIVDHIDPDLGGFRGAPKFPQVPLFEFLWRAYLRSNDAALARAVTVTCEHMCQGGIYDHLGGGFARYSTDPLWLVPHFEKMLYDNAQLVSLLTLVWQRTRQPLFAERIAETIDWLLREMVADSGGFAATLDADSEGVEGKFYVWTEAEIEDVLGDDAQVFKKAYDVSAGGNWEGRNILNRMRVPRLEDAAEEATLSDLRERLLARRGDRIRPGWDDKVLADWNGLMITALVSAGRTFDRSDWLDAARSAYRFVVDHMQADDRLWHSHRLGGPRHAGVLDDYAAMAQAGLALYELDGDEAYLDQARAWVAILDTHFWDPDDHGYFLTAADTSHLIVRTKAVMDSAVPSGNGLILGVLARLALLTGDQLYKQRADHLVGAFSGLMDQNSSAISTFLNSFELLDTATQIVVIGDRNTLETNRFIDVSVADGSATLVVTVVSDADSLPNDHPGYGKIQLDGQTTVYVCTGNTCSLPITDPEMLAEQLRHARAEA